MRTHLLHIIFIAVFSVAVYAPALKNGFVYDDPDTVVNNTLIKDFGNLPELFHKDYFALSGETSYRPVVTFTYFLDYALYGIRPWGFHLTNILLHALNGIMLYMLLTLIFEQPEAVNRGSAFRLLFANPSFIASLLFLTNPVLTEAVNAVSFREDLLIFLFYTGTLLLHIRLSSRPSAVLYLLSCITYSLALFSKEMAVSLPLTIFCYELIYSKDKMGRRSILFNSRNMGYVALTIVYIYLRFSHLMNPIEAGFNFPEWSVAERLTTFPWLFLNYLRLTILPISLSVDYMTPPLKSTLSFSFIVSLAVFVSVLTVAFLLMKRQKEISFGIFFFMATLAPVYNLVPIGHPVPLAERFLYLPIAGFAIVLGTAVLRSDIKNLYLYALLAMLPIYIPATAMRSMVWKNDYMLWSDTVRKMPQNPFPHYALGLTFRSQGRLEDAKEHYRAALRLRPENPDADNIYAALGAVYDQQGRPDKAIEEYISAIKLKPGEPMHHYDLGVVYAEEKRFDDAIQEFNIVLRLAPVFIEARHNLGMAYMEIGMADKAKKEFETVLKLKPDFVLSRKAIEYIEGRIKQR